MNQSALVPSPAAGGHPPHDYGAYISRAISIYTSDIGKWALIGLVGAFAIGVGFWGGYYYCAAKALRGEQVEIGDVFHPFSRFLSFVALPAAIFGIYILLFIFGAILGLIGLRFLLIPLFVLLPFAMIAIGIALFWTYPLMADRGMGFVDAAKMSIDTVKSSLGGSIVTVLVVGICMSLSGMIPFALAAAIGPIMAMLAYRCVFYQEAAAANAGQQQVPQQQPWGQQPAPQQHAPQQQAWGQQPAPQQHAPQQQPWGQQPAPQQHAPQQQAAEQQWGQPAAAPMAAAAAPMAAPQAAQAPQAAAPAPQTNPAPMAAAAPPSGAPTELPTEDAPEETATQSTAVNPDEQFKGKTMAMSASDFEELLKQQNNNS